MNGMKRKRTRKIPTNKEREACLARGYKISETYLGGGAMGRVFLALPKSDAIKRNMKLQLFAKENKNFQVAIKIIYLDKGAKTLKRCVVDFSREVEIMNLMFGNQKILQLLDVFVGFKRIFLVTEFISGGSLRDVKRSLVGSSRKSSSMNEDLARYYFSEVVKGVACLHEKSIAHRDLKLENILVTNTGQIKVADLGFSVRVHPNSSQNQLSMFIAKNFKNTTFCGTPCYMAPEVLRRHGGYDAIQADVWSLGVMLFRLTNRGYPYAGSEMKHIYCCIKKRGEALPFSDGISKHCKDLVKRMLCFEPSKRLTASEILDHPWMKKPIQLPINYKNEQVEIDSSLLLKIKNNPGYQQEATYIRSYLFQRAKLLRIYRKKIKRHENLPKQIYKEFGVAITVPRHEGGDEVAQTELWRIMRISIRSSDDESDDDDDSSDYKVDSKLAICPNYGLSLNCRWISDDFGSTVGVDRVRRVVQNLSTLDRWREFRNGENQPITDLEKCIKLYNTVELNMREPRFLSRHSSALFKQSFLTERRVAKRSSDPCEVFVRHHPSMDDVETCYVNVTSRLESIDELSKDESLDAEEEFDMKIGELANHYVDEVMVDAIQPITFPQLIEEPYDHVICSMITSFDVKEELDNKIDELSSHFVDETLDVVVRPIKSISLTEASRDHNIGSVIGSSYLEEELDNETFHIPIIEQKTSEVNHQPNISIRITKASSNDGFTNLPLLRTFFSGNTLYVDTNKSSNSLKSVTKVNIEEDTSTSISISQMTSSDEPNDEPKAPENPLNVTRTIKKNTGTHKATPGSDINFEIQPLQIKTYDKKVTTWKTDNSESSDMAQKCTNSDINVQVPDKNIKKDIESSQSLTAFGVSKFVSSQCSLSFVSDKTNNLSVYDMGRISFFSQNILGHVTGSCASRSDSVVEQGCSSDEANYEFRYRAQQVFIAERLLDACRSLVQVRNGLASLDKLNRKDLENILHLSLSFGDVKKDSEEYEIVSDHFRLIVDNALKSGANSEPSAPIARNAAGPSTSIQTPSDQLRLEHGDKCADKKVSKFLKFRRFFKIKQNSKKPKSSRWKSFLNRFNCFKSAE